LWPTEPDVPNEVKATSRPKAALQIKPDDGCPQTSMPSATERRQAWSVRLAAFDISWPGHEIPQQAFVTGNTSMKSCLCAPNDLRFRAKNLRRTEDHIEPP
jgi:hypothetical protein